MDPITHHLNAMINHQRQAAIDLSAQTIELVVAAMRLRDGNGTIEEARAVLAELKAAVTAIVI